VKGRVLVVLCVLALLGAVCSAQAATVGSSEIMGAGAWIEASAFGESVHGTLLGVSYGRFVHPNVQLRGDLIYGNVSAFGFSGSAWLIAPSALYYFPMSNQNSILPYVGAGFTFANVSGMGESDSSFKLSYMAGVKFYIGGDQDTATKSVFVEYRHTNVEIFGSPDIGLNMLWTGISTKL